MARLLSKFGLPPHPSNLNQSVAFPLAVKRSVAHGGKCLRQLIMNSESCMRTAYKQLNVQTPVPMMSSSDPPALLDDGIDASGGEVVFCDARTLQGSVDGQSLDTRGERKRTRFKFLMRSYMLLS